MLAFNPNMLTVARESREVTQAELAARSGVPQGVLSKIEAGIKVPSPGIVEAIASALSYPISFFNDQDRIFGFNASVFFHRKRSDLPSKALKRIHAELNLTRMRIDKLLLAGHISPAIQLQRFSMDEHGPPEEIAARVRATLVIPDGPIDDLTMHLEEAGVFIVQCRFHTQRMDAVSEWVPGHPPIILINSDPHIPGDRYRWTLAHEFGHLLMHTRPTDEMEEQANRFAAEFLMPARDIRSQLKTVKIQVLAILKSVWKVSMSALLERARQLGTLTPRQYTNMRILFSKQGYNRSEPEELNVALEQPTLFHSLVDLHTGQLAYNLDELAHLLRLNSNECLSLYWRQPGLRLLAPSSRT